MVSRQLAQRAVKYGHGLRRKGKPRVGITDNRADGHDPYIVHMPWDRHLTIIRDANQSAVKHPMCGSREGKSVAHDVRPVGLDRPYMRGFDLGPPAAIYQL
jgi:hypothetical protein